MLSKSQAKVFFLGGTILSFAVFLGMSWNSMSKEVPKQTHEHNGIWRDFDEDDDLEDHQDALDELNMKYTVRVDDVAHSNYQAEFTENTSIAESSEQHNNDYDNYEGKYGIQDVTRVLLELKRENINAYALAIEAQAKYYLPQMFGQNQYQMLTTPNELLTSLAVLYEKIKR